jgi:PPK2 family polyphosphate:nucleotide phosphotransferase
VPKTFFERRDAKVGLDDISAEPPKDLTREKVEPRFEALGQELFELQEEMFAAKVNSVLVVLQGRDTAGKDGTIKHVAGCLNPRGVNVVSFGVPTAEEREHDFLWRVHRHAPRLGEFSIFNRSHYEDVLVVRVHKLVPKEVWSQRYDVINDFERTLVLGNTTILKFFLYISKDEQLQRFKDRLDDPAKQWKISDADYKERDFWNDYTSAYEDMLSKCSTKHAPWYVIPSNHKWFRNLAISQIICATLEDLGMKMPKPSVDIAAIKAMYHRAATDQTKGR